MANTLKSRNPVVAKFLYTAQEDLKNHGVTLYTFKTRPRGEILDYDGCFDHSNKTLHVKKTPEWLSVFVHEYTHFLQWINGEPSFCRFFRTAYEPVEVSEKWINNKIPYNNKVKTSFDIIRNNEYECDKQALVLIKKYELPIDTVLYAQRANKQLLFYHCVEATQNWYPKRGFYSPEFTQSLPTKMQRSYIKSPPARIMDQIMPFFQDPTE
jgi:hypothetical protein